MRCQTAQRKLSRLASELISCAYNNSYVKKLVINCLMFFVTFAIICRKMAASPDGKDEEKKKPSAAMFVKLVSCCSGRLFAFSCPFLCWWDQPYVLHVITGMYMLQLSKSSKQQTYNAMACLIVGIPHLHVHLPDPEGYQKALCVYELHLPKFVM